MATFGKKNCEISKGVTQSKNNLAFQTSTPDLILKRNVNLDREWKCSITALTTLSPSNGGNQEKLPPNECLLPPNFHFIILSYYQNGDVYKKTGQKMFFLDEWHAILCDKHFLSVEPKFF